jgi:hypothetical protein
MSETLDALKKLLEGCSDEERITLLDYFRAPLPRHPLEEGWGVDAEIILSAISRSSDLTDLTGVFCTSGSEREFTQEERWYADEEIQAGADRSAATAD